MALRLITPPAIEPITAAELKLQEKVDSSAEDSLLAIYIAAARETAEGLLGRALITQTWEQTLDAFPSDEIKLLMPMPLAISSVTYVDTNGDTQTLDSDAYVLDRNTSPGWLLPALDTEWPDTADYINSVTITYTAGFGPSATDVPAGIRAWLLLTAATMYANRESVDATGRVADMPGRFVDRLLDKFRCFGV